MDPEDQETRMIDPTVNFLHPPTVHNSTAEMFVDLYALNPLIASNAATESDAKKMKAHVKPNKLAVLSAEEKQFFGCQSAAELTDEQMKQRRALRNKLSSKLSQRKKKQKVQDELSKLKRENEILLNAQKQPLSPEPAAEESVKIKISLRAARGVKGQARDFRTPAKKAILNAPKTLSTNPTSFPKNWQHHIFPYFFGNVFNL